MCVSSYTAILASQFHAFPSRSSKRQVSQPTFTLTRDVQTRTATPQRSRMLTLLCLLRYHIPFIAVLESPKRKSLYSSSSRDVPGAAIFLPATCWKTQLAIPTAIG